GQYLFARSFTKLKLVNVYAICAEPKPESLKLVQHAASTIDIITIPIDFWDDSVGLSGTRTIPRSVLATTVSALPWFHPNVPAIF
ncbi:MAG: hypothetical protein ACKOAH_22590, partial [Pirellula sp.]